MLQWMEFVIRQEVVHLIEMKDYLVLLSLLMSLDISLDCLMMEIRGLEMVVEKKPLMEVSWLQWLEQRSGNAK